MAAYVCVPAMIVPGFWPLHVPDPYPAIGLGSFLAGVVAAVYAVTGWKKLGRVEKCFAGVGYLIVMSVGVIVGIVVVGKLA